MIKMHSTRLFYINAWGNQYSEHNFSGLLLILKCVCVCGIVWLNNRNEQNNNSNNNNDNNRHHCACVRCMQVFELWWAIENLNRTHFFQFLLFQIEFSQMISHSAVYCYHFDSIQSNGDKLCWTHTIIALVNVHCSVFTCSSQEYHWRRNFH